MSALFALLVSAKFGKVLFSAGSMLLSILVYAQLFGYPYAIGFVLLLLCHEAGHFVAARQRGLSVSLPTFIPFVGAWISLKDQDLDPETEAFVALAGPLLGTTAAFLVYLWAISEGSQAALAIAYAGFVLNLFNLIPVIPLDGGHIVNLISPKLWLLGLPLLGAVFLWNHSPLLILVALIAVPRVWAALRAKTPPVSVPAGVRYRVAAEYLGLVAFLGYMSADVHAALGR